MDLFYELGNNRSPKGHALVYCRSVHNQSEIYATYVVVPPIAIDLGKFLPPMITSQFSLGNLGAVNSAVPLPPMLERFESYEALRQIAERRGDDLIAAGNVDPSALPNMLGIVQEIAQTYSEQYTGYVGTAPPAEAPSALDAADVLASLMGESEMVRELAKLTGQLRYAIEGNDATLTGDTVRQMERLGKNMPPKYRVDELITAGQIPGEKGTKLAGLYVDRCYKIAAEEYRDVQQIDQRINELQAL